MMVLSYSTSTSFYAVVAVGLSAAAKMVDAAAINADMLNDAGIMTMEHGYPCAIVWITAGVLVGLLVGTTSYKLRTASTSEKALPVQ
ncbi:hypothetical protein FB639_003789 [Coemansia asiatica]|nr:hypothetical protein FB639_003789 [Coemansia asiatica]